MMKPIKQLMDLSGRKALVTGGAGHIGYACCETLRELGASVAILDIDARKISAGDAKLYECDLSDEAKTRAVVRAAVNDLKGLDVLIHSAAFVGTTSTPGWATSFEKQTVEAWDKAMRVNLTAAFVLIQETHEALAVSGSGSAIFISSIYGAVGPDMRLYEGTNMANPLGYGASKGGLLQLMRSCATVLAPRIRVNAISPGGVFRGQPESFHKCYKEKTPLGRMATEEDLKGAVAYLASDLSKYVTGHNLVVDGGWTAW